MHAIQLQSMLAGQAYICFSELSILLSDMWVGLCTLTGKTPALLKGWVDPLAE